ncbi:MAG: hypothetical protein A7316_02590 [Candidatus Altiarchaeales archaeon WOR_SM1_86-2]|nr:MAG: hypothetical protein A7316_02590 [Candidatus Altiarchaeales archaeon WOR_SM1_86-2]
MLDIVVILIILLFLSAASYSDLRTGEVPDKISFGLVIILLLLSAAYSIYHQKLWVIDALIIGGVYFIVGYVMYYLGQWGGADVKILAGVGLGIGLIAAHGGESVFAFTVDHHAVSYLVDILFIITPYVGAYALILGVLNKGVFSGFKGSIREKNFLIIFFLSLIPAAILLPSSLTNIMPINKFLIIIALILPPVVLLSQYLKVVEKTALRKTIDVEELSEYDMVAEDIIVDGEKIACKRDVDGLSKEQIEKIRDLAGEQKIPPTITVKYGIFFIPVFLLAFLLFLWAGNVLKVLVSLMLI